MTQRIRFRIDTFDSSDFMVVCSWVFFVGDILVLACELFHTSQQSSTQP